MLREIREGDFELFWPTFESIISERETYAFDPEMSFDEAYQLWCKSPLKTYVWEEYDQILGSYYIKPNALGPSSHICNCGYMVSERARGKGLARKMCEHSQHVALKLCFRAMQFNSVVSTNTVAVELWRKLGFKIIGTIPDAYLLKGKAYVDSYIMYKSLV